jgi:hypothetical protein
VTKETTSERSGGGKFPLEWVGIQGELDPLSKVSVLIKVLIKVLSPLFLFDPIF